jgi:hypothetical protein
MGERADLCSTCKEGSLQQTAEVVVHGESGGEFKDIGSRRVFRCGNCGQRQVRVGHQEYVNIGDNVKTEPANERT